METYQQMKARHQDEVNALPLAFAFSKEQYREKLAAWNITEEEADAGAIIGIGAGGFIKSSDKDLVFDTLRRHRDEMRAAIEADKDGTGFLYEALKAELINTEYSYTGDAAEAVAILGLTIEDLDTLPYRIAFKKATDELSGADPFDE